MRSANKHLITVNSRDEGILSLIINKKGHPFRNALYIF